MYHGERLLHTWRELADRALRLAGSLRRAGGPGARIVIASENRPEIIELMFATWAADCVVVPVNYKLHPREMAQIIADAGADLVFASPTLAAGLTGAVPIEIIGSTAYLERFQGEPTAPPDPDPTRLAWLFYTSGTTGRSKGAMLTHRNLTAMTVAHLADLDDPDADCSLIHGAPMSHGSGLYIAPYVLRGARQVVPASGRSTPANSSTCAGIIRAPPRFWRRPWSRDWWTPDASARPTCAPSSTAAARCTSGTSNAHWPRSARCSPSSTARAKPR